MAAAEVIGAGGAHGALRRRRRIAAFFPGGRSIESLGIQYITGPGPHSGLASVRWGKPSSRPTAAPSASRKPPFERKRPRVVRTPGGAEAKESEPATQTWRPRPSSWAWPRWRTESGSLRNGNSGQRSTTINPADGAGDASSKPIRMDRRTDSKANTPGQRAQAAPRDRWPIFDCDTRSGKARIEALIRRGRLPSPFAPRRTAARIASQISGDATYKPSPAPDRKQAQATALPSPRRLANTQEAFEEPGAPGEGRVQVPPGRSPVQEIEIARHRQYGESVCAACGGRLGEPVLPF